MGTPDTRQRILTAAEELFGQRGFQGVSIREITHLADANLASVNYHFGSKAGLIRSLVEHHLGSLNQERLDLLEQASANSGGATLPVEQILDIFFRPPVFRFVGPGRTFPGLLARLHNSCDPELIEVMLRVFGPLADRFLTELCRSVPHLEPRTLLARVNFMVGAMIHALAEGETMAQAFAGLEPRQQDPEFLTRQLVLFCAAGLRHE